jgi:hypothetical protein
MASHDARARLAEKAEVELANSTAAARLVAD